MIYDYRLTSTRPFGEGINITKIYLPFCHAKENVLNGTRSSRPKGFSRFGVSLTRLHQRASHSKKKKGGKNRTDIPTRRAFEAPNQLSSLSDSKNDFFSRRKKKDRHGNKGPVGNVPKKNVHFALEAPSGVRFYIYILCIFLLCVCLVFLHVMPLAPST